MTGGRHFLVVAPFDPENGDDLLSVEHPPDCPTLVIDRDPDGNPVTVENCAVGFYVDQYGISEYFEHADDGADVVQPVPVGRHEIEAWHEIHRGFDYVEHSAGLRLVPR
jgi:hypothetical protein